MTRPITLKDVAAYAGVSYKTVSRVINGERHVSQAVREIVQRAVEDLDYRPNAFARTLKSSRSFLIGLFIDDPASGYAADVLHGALLRCRERSYHLVVEPVDPGQTNWIQQVEANIAALRLDGAIIAPPICDKPELLEIFGRAQLPVVLLSPNDVAEPSAIAIVEMDDKKAACEMTEHLLHLGHRKIGFIKGPRTHGVSSRRYIAFRETMAAAGLSVPDGDILDGDFTFRSGMDLASILLGGPDKPTAIFASNDDMALGVLACALKAGVSVPEKLSIAGFDDAPASRLAWPQLTTIKQPKAAMAAAAVDMIVDLRRSTEATSLPQLLTLPHELLVRESTGPSPV